VKFLWCTINVKDMEESVLFYEEIIGLRIDRRFPIESGETKVELVSDGSGKWHGNKDGISIGFEAESLDKQMALVNEKGIAITGGPFYPGPDIGFFYIKDPNGVSIQFVESK